VLKSALSNIGRLKNSFQTAFRHVIDSMKKHLYRITLVSIAAAILAACPSKSIKNLPETDTSVIKGPDRPTGTPDPVGTTVSGGGANYTVVSYNELPHWDGHCPAPNSIQYSTCNKQNADIVQALAHMSGRAAVIKLKHRNLEKHPNWNQAYVVDIWLTPKNCHEIRIKPEVSDFSGSVYCAETPTGYFLVRRNGKVWITGNSGRHIQLQNLPQNHLSDLKCARDLVRQGS